MNLWSDVKKVDKKVYTITTFTPKHHMYIQIINKIE